MQKEIFNFEHLNLNKPTKEPSLHFLVQFHIQASQAHSEVKEKQILAPLCLNENELTEDTEDGKTISDVNKINIKPINKFKTRSLNETRCTYSGLSHPHKLLKDLILAPVRKLLLKMPFCALKY